MIEVSRYKPGFVNRPRPERGMATYISAKANKDDDDDRLVALSALLRAAAFVKSEKRRLAHLLPPVLTRPIPSLQRLSDSDSRYYVASALSFALVVPPGCARPWTDLMATPSDDRVDEETVIRARLLVHADDRLTPARRVALSLL